MKKLLSMLLVCLTIAGLSGCSPRAPGQPDDSAEREKIQTITVAGEENGGSSGYRAKIVSPAELASAYVLKVLPSSEGIYFLVVKWENQDGAVVTREIAYEADPEGNLLREIDLGTENGAAAVSPSGELWFTRQTETEDKSAMKYEVCRAGDGLQKVLELSSDGGSSYDIAVADDCIYVNEIYSDGSQYLLHTYDRSGNFVTAAELDAHMELYPTKDGLYLYDSYDIALYRLGSDGASLTEVWKAAPDSDYRLLQVYEDAVYLCDSSYAYALDLDSGEASPLFRWDSFGILRCDAFYRLRDGAFFVYSMLNSTSPYRLLLPAGESGAQRQELIFAINDPDLYGENSIYSMYADAIRDFNDTNAAYFITVKNYSECSSPQTLLNADIAAKGGPDLVELSHFSPELISPEKCEDLMPYLEKDPELSPDALLPGPLALLQTDGQLLSMVPSFYVNTLVCAAQELPEGGLGGYPELLSLNGGEKTLLGVSCSRQELLYYAFAQNRRNYSADEIAAILELASALPEAAESGRSDILSGERLFEIAKIAYPITAGLSQGGLAGVAEERLYFGADIAMPGLPAAGGCFPMLTPVQELILPKNAANKEGAWEFIKFVLTQRYQLGLSGYKNGIPILNDAFNAGFAYAEDWIKTYGTVPANFGGNDYVITDDRDSRQFWELANSVGAILRGEDELCLTVYSLANEYFAGKKSLSDASGDIASRLNIYFSERD